MNESATFSQELRVKGNEAYLAGRILEAISIYQEAANASPDDPAPLSNLSAAFFESGDYNASISASDQALALNNDESKRQKLYMRKAKSFIHLRKYESVAETIDLLDDGPEKKKLRNVTLRAPASPSDDHRDNALTTSNRLITELPRYKEMIRNVPQYFTVGHDIPETLYDPELLDTGRDKISLLLAGVGDARHLHKTFVIAGFHDATKDRCFHFTIVDHKPAVIARDVLVLLMIHEFSQLLHDDQQKANSLIFPLFYYTYISPIMPPLMHDVLQAKISDAIAILNEPELMPAFLDVPIAFRAEVVRVLTEWQEEVGSEYPTKRVRHEVIRQGNERIQSQLDMLKRYGKGVGDMKPSPESCEKEQAFYEEFGVLTMNWASHQLFYEEELQQAFADFDMSNRAALNTDFLDVIDENWKVNPTFVDLEWQRNREDSHAYLVVNHDPFEYGHDLLDTGAKAMEKQGLLNIVSFWFNGVCHSFSRMKDRCKVEACIGDIATVLEQLNSGTVGRRTGPAEESESIEPVSTDPADKFRMQLANYPTAYDRIHLSNIPDYIGGSLPTYLHAIPALHPGEHSYVTATCLRNPSRWKSHQHFDNEYIGLSEPSDLESIFHVKMEPAQDLGGYPVLAQYVKWHHQPVQPSFANLLPRQRLETWLYRLFFKLAIPVTRSMRDPTLIYSPLNLTAFLRLCCHLHKIGYPAHWISVVLEDLVSGNVKTKARPPRTDPLAIEENTGQKPALRQTTKPFVTELSTLLSLWQTTLPFDVLSENIPLIQDVHKYEFDFPKCEDLFGESPVFVLVLFHLKFLPKGATEGLRPILLDDEVGNASPQARLAREEGMHIISTWRWKRDTNTATFWLREDVLNRHKGDEDWGLSIWRTDSWVLHSGPRSLRGLRDMGRF